MDVEVLLGSDCSPQALLPLVAAGTAGGRGQGADPLACTALTSFVNFPSLQAASTAPSERPATAGIAAWFIAARIDSLSRCLAIV